MTVTLDDLVEYSQGIDARLAALDVDKLKDKIRYGVNNLATQELCFSITEVIPFSQFTNVGLTSFSITPSKEIINYYLTTVVNSVYDPFYRDWETDRKSTRLNSSHRSLSRMPSSA